MDSFCPFSMQDGYDSWSTSSLDSSDMGCECEFIWLFVIGPDNQVKNSLIVELALL